MENGSNTCAVHLRVLPNNVLRAVSGAVVADDHFDVEVRFLSENAVKSGADEPDVVIRRDEHRNLRHAAHSETSELVPVASRMDCARVAVFRDRSKRSSTARRPAAPTVL